MVMDNDTATPHSMTPSSIIPVRVIERYTHREREIKLRGYSQAPKQFCFLSTIDLIDPIICVSYSYNIQTSILEMRQGYCILISYN